jgi:hypothetical protein
MAGLVGLNYGAAKTESGLDSGNLETTAVLFQYGRVSVAARTLGLNSGAAKTESGLNSGNLETTNDFSFVPPKNEIEPFYVPLTSTRNRFIKHHRRIGCDAL